MGLPTTILYLWWVSNLNMDICDDTIKKRTQVVFCFIFSIHINNKKACNEIHAVL